MGWRSGEFQEIEVDALVNGEVDTGARRWREEDTKGGDVSGAWMVWAWETGLDYNDWDSCSWKKECGQSWRMHTWTRLRGAEWVRETDIVRLLHGWGCRRIELLQDWVGNKRKTTSWEECTELLETRNVCFRGILHRILGGRRFVEDLGN